MAGYSTSNPPALIATGIGGGKNRLWLYSSVDASSLVQVSGYFTNGYSLGIRAGDVLFCIDSDASPQALQVMICAASSKSGATETVDFGAGTTITATNND